MITYKWIFSAFDCRVDEDGMQDVVTTVHWRYNGTTKDGISAEIYGAQAVGTPTPDAFTPYPELNEEQVIGWMEETMDVPAMQLNIAEQIELIINPVMVTLPPPFANTEETVVAVVDGDVIIEEVNVEVK
jgi:hypothetical protein